MQKEINQKFDNEFKVLVNLSSKEDSKLQFFVGWTRFLNQNLLEQEKPRFLCLPFSTIEKPLLMSFILERRGISSFPIIQWFAPFDFEETKETIKNKEELELINYSTLEPYQIWLFAPLENENDILSDKQLIKKFLSICEFNGKQAIINRQKKYFKNWYKKYIDIDIKEHLSYSDKAIQEQTRQFNEDKHGKKRKKFLYYRTDMFLGGF